MRWLGGVLAAVVLVGCGESRADRQRAYEKELREYRECFFSQVVGVNTSGDLTRKQLRDLARDAVENPRDCVEPVRPKR